VVSQRPPSAVEREKDFFWRACPDEVGTKVKFFEIKLKGFRKEKERILSLKTKLSRKAGLILINQDDEPAFYKTFLKSLNSL
jgi:hypothetical protein